MSRRQAVIFLVGFFFVFGLASLVIRGSNEALKKVNKHKAVAEPTKVVPIDEGNGIFYFPVTGEAYRRSLAAFYKSGKARHCALQGFTEELVERDTYNSRTVTTGFILHCRDLAVEAQSITVP